MKKQILKNSLLAAVLTIGVLTQASAAHLGDRLTFSARMNGAQEVPAITTDGLGVATMTLNATRDTMCMSGFMVGLSQAASGLHFHMGAAGSNGAVLIDLTPYLINDNIEAVITGSALTPAFIQAMIEGNIYLNAHNANNANGEIRGQVKLETDFAFRSLLNGAKEVPAVSTAATGLGIFNLSLDKKKMNYWIVSNGLSGAITGAHLHIGDAATAGPVSANLSANIDGNTIVGSVRVDTLAGFVSALEMGNIYINLHTAANANGEIRSQLDATKVIEFDGFLDTIQEMPTPSGSSATGTAYFSLNADFTAINYEVQVDGLTGPIMGAHLHNATAGNNGPVLVDLSGDVTGNRISGTITGTDLTDALIKELLESAIYINVHTAANPNGEVRGQINRLAREGYTVNMTGDQEVPGVSAPANGGGIVTISRQRDNVHVMLVAKQLSGNLGGAHFHNGAVGTNGPVMFDLSDLFSQNATFDGAFGYLTAEDAAPFLTSDEALFRNNQVYVNIHTAANANGEIRGQAYRGSECTNRVVGLNENEALSSTSVYPNPSTDKIQISVENFDGASNVQVVDLYGKVVLSSTMTSSTSTLNIQSLTAGVYLLKVGNNQAVRIIKQ
jgi:hypothetical protein